MSSPDFVPRPLTDKEQETFRRDFQDKEREIQRYIGVYLSGLVIVTGWVIGPQSRPVIAMALGNGGYNIYAFLIFLVLNIVFTIFLINKSLVIHEITQFMTYLAKPDSAYVYWDRWRRSRQSATRPVRAIYTMSLAVLPFCASAILMYGVWHVVFRDPASLVQQLQNSEPASVAVSAPPSNLASVFRWAKVWFAIVAVLHFFPVYFFWQNWIPTKRRWKRIHELRGSEDWFDELRPRTTNSASAIDPSRTVINLYDKATQRLLGMITEEELRFLQDNLAEEGDEDHDYYLSEATIESLENRRGDKRLLQLLRKNLGSTNELEIEWKREAE
jgi:hypothetical protein